jgi:thiamine pyrophosphate-dependent acetolactate synthase large subunit-like protein
LGLQVSERSPAARARRRRLTELWGGRGFEVLSARQFREALAEAWRDERHALIEVSIPKGDISIVLRRFVDARKARAAGAR